jgi:hypothetical protein
MLARAVAADLDVIDTGWASQSQRATLILGCLADQTPLSPNGNYAIFTDQVEKQVGTELEVGSFGLRVSKGGDGWYHLTLQCHSRANGTITADAQHRCQIQKLALEYGNYVSKRTYYFESFQSGSLDMYTMGEAVVHLAYGEEIRPQFFHTNTGSDARIVASGTRLTGSLIVLDSD